MRLLAHQRLKDARTVMLYYSLPDEVYTHTLVDALLASGKRVLLVDDIITTGATVSACALALQQAGAYEITAAAVAATEELPKSLQKSTEKRK